MKQFALNIAHRDGIGRRASRRTREVGRIPAVVYGTLNPPEAVSLDVPEFTKLLKAIGGSAAIVEIKQGDNRQRLSVIQEVQRDPLTDRILHVDLHEVAADEELEVEVRVHAVGDCIGVRTENGILEEVAHKLRVHCLPRDLPPFVEVDVSNLHINQSIHVRDIAAIPGVKFVSDPGQSIFVCVEPVVEVEAAPAAAEAVPVAGEAAAAAAGAAPAAAPAAEAKPGEKTEAKPAEKKEAKSAAKK